MSSEFYGKYMKISRKYLEAGHRETAGDSLHKLQASCEPAALHSTGTLAVTVIEHVSR